MKTKTMTQPKWEKEFEKKFVNKKVAHDEWDDENRSTLVECDDWKYDALPTEVWSWIETLLTAHRQEIVEEIETNVVNLHGYKMLTIKNILRVLQALKK